MDTRETALSLFMEMEKTGAYGSALLKDTLDKYDYEDPRDKAFLKRLAEGTMEKRITLDWVIDRYSKTPVKKMKPLIRSLLRLSAYQILYMDSVPDAVACSEAVRLAKKRGFSSLSGFVNGVLRSIARGKNDIAWPDPEQEPVKALSVKYSLPEWMIGLWRQQYGAERCERLLAAMEQRRPITIRFSEKLSEAETEEAVERIRRTGVFVRRHDFYPKAWVLDGCEGAASLPGFAEGLFYVQDVSSMTAVLAAGIRTGMRVMDLCAAPGGKATFAAQLCAGDGSGKKGVAAADGQQPAGGAVLAGDVSEQKVRLIRENAERLGIGNLETRVWDASVFMEEYRETADVVLLDVPCSGLGVMNRKKDIRYRVTRQDLDDLACLQKRIIDACWQYVKPGGILLYSTCTVDRLENEDMVDYITGNYPFTAESMDGFVPQAFVCEETKEGRLQLFCGEKDTDGFFMARLRRKGKDG